MKERGKRAATERNDDVSFADSYYYSASSEFHCRKHPSVSAVGICPYCLKDRLVNLVCSECGEQRLSSCSCSDFSPNRTSNAAAVDAGNVIRISSLIDDSNNEETTKQGKTTTMKGRKTEEVVVFKRSNSSCVEIRKKNHRFSKIGRFFRKINPKKDRDLGVKSVYGGGIDEKNDSSWGLDYNDGKKLGVSRSRSLCSFRGNGYFIGSEDGSSYSGARSSFSAARSSSVNGGLGFSEAEQPARRSGFEGRKSGFSETEHRKSNFSESEPPRRSCFEARKSNFSETEYRKSNFSETEQRRGYNMAAEHPRRSNFSETEQQQRRNSNFSETEQRRCNYEAARKSNFNETTTEQHQQQQQQQHRKSDSSAMNFTRRVFSMKESYFTGGEEPGFIDLKFDFSSTSSDNKIKQEPVRTYGHHDGDGDVYGGVLDHGGGSCRITTKDREVRKSRRSFKGWKWIFGHHHHNHHQHHHHHHQRYHNQTVKKRDIEIDDDET